MELSVLAGGRSAVEIGAHEGLLAVSCDAQVMGQGLPGLSAEDD